MSGRRTGWRVVVGLAVAAAAAGASAAEPCFAGLCRSSYQLKDRSQDDAWWAERARLVATRMTSSTRPVSPVVVQAVGIGLDTGVCRMEFARPGGIPSDPPGMEFKADARIDHGRALDAYARQGVKAILQVEPAKADVVEALRIVNRVFGRHPAVIGFGVDAAWHRKGEAGDKPGLPVTDRDAEGWMLAVESMGPGRTLFLKHWKPEHLPPSYRHPRLWFLSNSQGFEGADAMVKDLRAWADAFRKQTVGFVAGFGADEAWWQKLPDAPTEVGLRLLRGVPNARFVLWADATADRIPAATPGRR